MSAEKTEGQSEELPLENENKKKRARTPRVITGTPAERYEQAAKDLFSKLLGPNSSQWKEIHPRTFAYHHAIDNTFLYFLEKKGVIVGKHSQNGKGGLHLWQYIKTFHEWPTHADFKAWSKEHRDALEEKKKAKANVKIGWLEGTVGQSENINIPAQDMPISEPGQQPGTLRRVYIRDWFTPDFTEADAEPFYEWLTTDEKGKYWAETVSLQACIQKWVLFVKHNVRRDAPELEPYTDSEIDKVVDDATKACFPKSEPEVLNVVDVPASGEFPPLPGFNQPEGFTTDSIPDRKTMTCGPKPLVVNEDLVFGDGVITITVAYGRSSDYGTYNRKEEVTRNLKTLCKTVISKLK